MSSRDDKELVRRCVQGQVQAFEPLVERYHKVLFSVALRMVNDYEDARDLTQTTFLKAFQNLHTYDPKHKFFSWIYRILVNESLNLIKRRKPREELDVGLVSLDRTPSDEYERRQLAGSSVTASSTRSRAWA
jgi:RNA polymerase sigma factor (sigma-70 family)